MGFVKQYLIRHRIGIAQQIGSYFEEDADRFADYVIDEEPAFQSFDEFQRAFKKKYNSDKLLQNLSEKASSKDISVLYFSETAQNRLLRNLKGDNGAVQRENLRVKYELEQPEGMRQKELPVPVYQIQTRKVTLKSGKTYNRSVQRNFTKGQELFIREYKEQGLKPHQVWQLYDAHYSEKRTYRSIKNKYYKISSDSE
jgi:hypothetical protein